MLLYEMLLGQSPFSGCDEDELFWSICNEKPVLPRYLSADASNVLTLVSTRKVTFLVVIIGFVCLKFLEKDGNKRLGNRNCPAGSIEDQPFFRSIDWVKLEARKLESPFKPNLVSNDPREPLHLHVIPTKWSRYDYKCCSKRKTAHILNRIKMKLLCSFSSYIRWIHNTLTRLSPWKRRNLLL